jgi:aspartyl-tRNA(Asn)/glutamyl-tRNA(Gln) amidotransferase subunit C
MSSLTKDDVKHIAKLSSLPLTNDQIITNQKQLSEIVNYVEELQEVDVSETEPTSQTTGLVNVTREDEINPVRMFSQEEATSEAEHAHNGFFKVPPVITKSYDDQ